MIVEHCAPVPAAHSAWTVEDGVFAVLCANVDTCWTCIVLLVSWSYLGQIVVS